ncbi:MAG: HNH endonuclease [Planctomycetes bacterium]|nr:HNH endonuclease [Planctomycetota bacterium]OQZ06330.1 MAG: hypothetical protein B6D36_05490 [Planctomycetes bacterium UTPLA1]
MPLRPSMPCSYPGCPDTTHRRYCEKHIPKRDAEPEPRMTEAYAQARQFRSSKQWQQARARHLSMHPLCRDPLGQHGIPVIATEVHHIEPVAKRYDLRLTEGNLASLCETCHLMIEAKSRNGQDVRSLFGSDMNAALTSV